MLEKLIYRIADQYIVLHTPSREQTFELLESYKPFVQECLPEGEDFLLEVWGDTPALGDEKKSLLEEAKEDYFMTKLFKLEDKSFLLEMKYFKASGFAFYSENWREVRSSVSLVDSATKLLLDRFIMIAFGLATIPLGMLKVHASVTELNGRALVFMGVSGTGKSTHSRLWREHIQGCTLLNDDEPIVRLMPDGSVRVYGCPWSGSTDCYRDEWAELVAFVHLYQAPENKISKLSGRLAFDSLFSSVASMRTLSKFNLKLFETVVDVLSNVPLYRLDCLPNREAVALTYGLLNE